MADELDAQRRSDFFRRMANAEEALRSDPERWAEYLAERDAWLDPDLSGPQTSQRR